MNKGIILLGLGILMGIGLQARDRKVLVYTEANLNPDIHVLLAHEMNTIKDEGKAQFPGNIFGDLFPSAWYHEFDGGREWYTAYGHNILHYSDPMLLASCTGGKKDSGVTFTVADPGHFHAALVLKSMYEGVNPKVFVYAQEGPELADFNARVNSYQKRAENPTNWEIKEYRGSEFFDKMIAEKPGNVLILAGNNRQKTDYILKAVQTGTGRRISNPISSGRSRGYLPIPDICFPV
ncbi:MAG: ThuA domain-containing protein [Bacteroidales bacterium]